MPHPLVETMDILAKHAQALANALVLTRDELAKIAGREDERSSDQS